LVQKIGQVTRDVTGEYRKIPCVERLIERKVRRVVIGMLDPNPIVRGLGFRRLRAANIQTDVFPHDLMAEVEDLNRDFIHAVENNPIHQTTQEIAVLGIRTGNDLQRAAVNRALKACVEVLRHIHHGQIPVLGREAGYFRRWLERAEGYQGLQHVKAYVRLSAFKPGELASNSWFQEFYRRLEELVRSGKIRIQYVFLLQTNKPTTEEMAFLDRYKAFAEEIRIVDQKGYQWAPEVLHPSIILFEEQRIGFTHDRGDDTVLLEVVEWIFGDDYDLLRTRYAEIELASNLYFRRTMGGMP
jgi:hypothetical protein